MQAPMLFHLVALAVVSLLAAGCSCGDDTVADAGAASDGARIDGAAADAWNPFIPTDGGPLIHEPCAEGLEVRLVEWPSATVAPHGGTPLTLAGHDDELAALWIACEEGVSSWDCSQREEGADMGWASFDAPTGALTGGGLLRAADWPQPRGPLSLGWTDDRWRVYFRFGSVPDDGSGPYVARIGWVDVPLHGGSAGVVIDSTFSFYLGGEAAATTFVTIEADETPVGRYRYRIFRDTGVEVYALEVADMASLSSPVISSNRRWVAFTGRVRESLYPMVGRIDIEDGSYVARELPVDLFPAVGAALPVVSVDESGQVILSTRVFRSGRAGPPWRLRYIWLDRELRVQSSWTSREEYTRGEWRSAVVGIGDAQLFVFVLHRGLFAGVSRTPGSIEGAGRPLLLLGADRPAGLEHHRLEVWSTGSKAYAAVAYENELALVALKCDH